MSISNVFTLRFLYSVNVSMASDSVAKRVPLSVPRIGTSDTTKVSFVASTLINKESLQTPYDVYRIRN